MKQRLLTCLLLLSGGCLAWGQTTFEQEDLVYTLYEDHAEVTGHSETLPASVKIPSEVTYENVEYPVTAIGNRVFRDAELEEIEIPSSVTSIGEFAFTSNNLKTLALPASLTDIGICAFRGCSGINAIEIPASVAHIGGGAFSCCMPVTVSPDNPYYTVVDGVLFNKDMTTILSYPVNGSTSYTIPSTVTLIDDWTFFYSGLEEIVIPSSVMTIGNSVFVWCGFTHVEIPSSVTTIGDGAFEWCRSLKSIDIPSSVTSIGQDAFRYDSALERATVPSSVTYVGKSVFEACESLADVEFNATISEIEYGVFRECKSLKSITIPPTVTLIGKSSFLQCESLTSVVIPPSVTRINDYAFSRCSNLTTLTLSPSLEKILSEAFTNCGSLVDVIYLADRPIYCNKGIFSDDTYERATLTLTPAAFQEIENKVPWKYFVNMKEDSISGNLSVDRDKETTTGVFDMHGRFISDSVDNLSPGLYVVRGDNSTRRIFVRE